MQCASLYSEPKGRSRREQQKQHPEPNSILGPRVNHACGLTIRTNLHPREVPVQTVARMRISTNAGAVLGYSAAGTDPAAAHEARLGHWSTRYMAGYRSFSRGVAAEIPQARRGQRGWCVGSKAGGTNNEDTLPTRWVTCDESVACSQ